MRKKALATNSHISQMHDLKKLQKPQQERRSQQGIDMELTVNHLSEVAYTLEKVRQLFRTFATLLPLAAQTSAR